MYDFTNVDPVKCCAWLVLPTVYDESLSYGEQLNKFCKALNELIENNNNLPDYVAEMIQNYITSGAIDEVVRNILASYILNVKYPPKGITPAVGDGSADDTDAIQGCIDYAFNQGGGCVYFPYGKYLSRSLTLRSGVSLVGFDRYSTRIVQRGGDTKSLVTGGNVQNVQISNLTLDGNNEVQTDDLDIVNVLGKDCLFTNLVIKSGFQCFVYNGLGGNLQVDNVVFGGAVKKVAVINGKDSVQFTNVKFNELGKVQGECILEVGASDGVYSFSSSAVSPLCISVSGSRNTFNCDIVNASNNFSDTGVLNNFNVLGVEVKEQLAQGKSSNVDGSATENVSGSKTETVGSDKVENVTGNKTETVGSDKVENVTGNKTETVGSDKVENVTGSKTETITKNKTENINGNREIDINADDSVHIDGVSTVNVGGARTEVYSNSRNIDVTGVNIEEYHNTMTENFGGKHNVNGIDEDNKFTGNVNFTTNKFTINSSEKTMPINFPDKTIDLYNVDKKLMGNVIYTGNVGTLTISTNKLNSVQGFTLDDDYFYVCSFTDEKSLQHITKINRTTGDYTMYDFSTLGHCNSCCLKDNYIYVCTWSLQASNLKIAKINKVNMTIESYITTSKEVNGMAYDKVTDTFYARTSDANYNILDIDTGELTYLFEHPEYRYSYTGQGFCVHNSEIYLTTTYPSSIIKMDLTGKQIFSCLVYPWSGMFRVSEIEDIEFDNESIIFNSTYYVPGNYLNYATVYQFSSYNFNRPFPPDIDYLTYNNHPTFEVNNNEFNFIRGRSDRPFYDLFEATNASLALESYGCNPVYINVTKTDKEYLMAEIRSNHIKQIIGNECTVRNLALYDFNGYISGINVNYKTTENSGIIINGITGTLNGVKFNGEANIDYNVSNSIIQLFGTPTNKKIYCENSILGCYDDFKFQLPTGSPINILNGIACTNINVTTTETKANLTNLSMTSGYTRFNKFVLTVNNIGYILYGDGTITVNDNTISLRVSNDGIYLKATKNITVDLHLY